MNFFRLRSLQIFFHSIWIIVFFTTTLACVSSPGGRRSRTPHSFDANYRPPLKPQPIKPKKKWPLMARYFKVSFTSSGKRVDTYQGLRGFWHKVGPRDCIERIGRHYQISYHYLKKINYLYKKKYLHTGQYVFIPLTDNMPLFSTRVRYLPRTRFAAPCCGRLSSTFGYRSYAKRRRHFHKGIDLAAPPGELVKAAKQGRVQYAGPYPGYGRVIIIKHSHGYETRYGHLQTVLVNKGDYVTQGKVIGKIGNSGRATGYHLHFEIRQNKRPLNPLKFLPSLKRVKLRNYKNKLYTGRVYQSAGLCSDQFLPVAKKILF